MHKILLPVLVCSMVVIAAAQEPDFSKVQIKATKVAGTVYMLEGQGGNIGVCAGEDGIVIVDDQFAPLADKIKAALKGITDKPVRFVINTHYHGDHVGGNADFAKSGSTIIAQENVRSRLASGTSVKAVGKTLPAPKDALPVITFSERATVHVNGEDVRAIHFPHGHTDGDAVIFFPKSEVVHMGDDFVTYGFPFVDIENGGSVSGMIAGVEKVLSMVPPQTKFIPGHGPISTGDDVRKFLKMLTDTRAIVAAGVKQGKTAEQMKQDRVLAPYDEQYGKGYLKANDWIDALYDDVTHSATGAHYINHGHSGEGHF